MRETARRQAKIERAALQDAGLLFGEAIQPLRERIQVRDAIATSAQRREEVAKLIDATVAAKGRYHEAARALIKLVSQIAGDRNLGERIRHPGAEQIGVDEAQMARFLDLFGYPEPRLVSDGEARARVADPLPPTPLSEPDIPEDTHSPRPPPKARP